MALEPKDDGSVILVGDSDMTLLDENLETAIAQACCCESEDFCWCPDVQPAASVVVHGDLCPELLDGAGTYAFDHHDDSFFYKSTSLWCAFFLKKAGPGDWVLRLIVSHKPSQSWAVWISGALWTVAFRAHSPVSRIDCAGDPPTVTGYVPNVSGCYGMMSADVTIWTP